MTGEPPFALFVRGTHEQAFDISDQLGFDMDMQALAVSVFEDGENSMHVQALYTTEAEAEAAQASLDLTGLEHFITQLPDEDWVAKSQAGLPPVQAGPFFVYGEHDKDNIPDEIAYPIQIDAGIAFGTGHHGTTMGCLLAFETYRHSISPENILDLGTGAGILAIAAAKAVNSRILATDIDPDAVMVTRQNAALNGVADRIVAETADGFGSSVIREAAPFDLIFANILAGPLIGLAPEISQALQAGGTVILSGILNEQADTLIKIYEEQGLSLQNKDQLAGWTTLTMVKPQ
ncbi:MAG: 50S ribosomal protein L11 methyltransferase [Acidimicrobiales bacterium]|nr:50S ribosomal protein L11 methyltransferase [Hyphomonadaceae bacterium]RZV42393.1 MAG: 50S ribosomal protein L11 methyltransferase [Acidimicrobiales bacterium]